MYTKHPTRNHTKKAGARTPYSTTDPLVLPVTVSVSIKRASAFYMLHLWFSFGYLDTGEAAILSLLNEGHLDRMLRNLNKIIILSYGQPSCPFSVRAILTAC